MNNLCAFFTEDHTKPQKDIFFLVCVCLFLYCFLLGSYPLTVPDESRYSSISLGMVLHKSTLIPLYNGIPFLDKPPLFYWLQAFFIKILGNSAWTLRIWPVCIATIGSVGTYLFGRALYNRLTGLYSALILSTYLLYFVMAHVTNMDLTVSTFITLSLYAIFAGIDPNRSALQRKTLCYLAYTFAGLGFLTKGLIALVLPGLVMGLWILLLNRWDILKKAHLLGGLFIIALIITPWLWAIQKTLPFFVHYFFYTQHIERYLSDSLNSKQAYWFYPLVIVLGSFPWTFWAYKGFKNALITLRKYGKQQGSTLLFLLVWFAVILLFFSIPKSKPFSYILPALPPIALLSGYFLSQKLQSCPKKTLSKVLFSLTISTAFYFTLMTLISQTSLSSFVLRSTKALALHLKHNLPKADTIIFYAGYSPDLTLYLEQDVLLVAPKFDPAKDNWQHDFALGLKLPKYKQHFRSVNWLKKRWLSSSRLYLFVNKENIGQLQDDLNIPYYQIAQYQDTLLVTNFLSKKNTS